MEQEVFVKRLLRNSRKGFLKKNLPKFEFKMQLPKFCYNIVLSYLINKWENKLKKILILLTLQYSFFIYTHTLVQVAAPHIHKAKKAETFH